jgi:hypothetical protein
MAAVARRVLNGRVELRHFRPGTSPTVFPS